MDVKTKKELDVTLKKLNSELSSFFNVRLRNKHFNRCGFVDVYAKNKTVDSRDMLEKHWRSDIKLKALKKLQKSIGLGTLKIKRSFKKDVDFSEIVKFILNEDVSLEKIVMFVWDVNVEGLIDAQEEAVDYNNFLQFKTSIDDTLVLFDVTTSKKSVALYDIMKYIIIFYCCGIVDNNIESYYDENTETYFDSLIDKFEKEIKADEAEYNKLIKTLDTKKNT